MKSSLYKFASFFAGLIPVKFLIKLSSINTIYPFYHIVSDHPPAHIKHLYKIRTKDQFKKDLDFLLKFFKPLSSIPEKIYRQNHASFLISFDDGLNECLNIILPILEEKQIKAIFFINSAFVGNKSLFYKYKASIISENLKSSKVKDETITKLKHKLNINSNQSINELISCIKKIDYSRTNLLDEIAELLDINFNVFLMNEKPYLSLQDLKNILERGHIIGAHSIDHPLFSEINPGEQLRQVSESIEYVLKEFQSEIKLFAFPFTDHQVSNSFFKELKIKNIIDYTFGTAGIKKDTAIDNIQRIPIELYGMSAEKTIKTEYLLYIIKKLIGKHKIKRN